jgi:hypothetical protein
LLCLPLRYCCGVSYGAQSSFVFKIYEAVWLNGWFSTYSTTYIDDDDDDDDDDDEESNSRLEIYINILCG